MLVLQTNPLAEPALFCDSHGDPVRATVKVAMNPFATLHLCDRCAVSLRLALQDVPFNSERIKYLTSGDTDDVAER